MKLLVFWEIHFQKRCSMLYYFGGHCGRGSWSRCCSRTECPQLCSADKPASAEQPQQQCPPNRGQRCGGSPGSQAALWASSYFSVAWNMDNQRDFLKKRRIKPNGSKPQKKQNIHSFKLPLLPLENNRFPAQSFHFQESSEVIPYLLIHEICGDGWPWICGLLGPIVSLSEQSMYWLYPTFTTSLDPSFCMFWEKDKIKPDSPWGAHWFHLPASGRAQCLDLLWNVCQLFCWREITVLLGVEQILQVAGSYTFLGSPPKEVHWPISYFPGSLP